MLVVNYAAAAADMGLQCISIGMRVAAVLFMFVFTNRAIMK